MAAPTMEVTMPIEPGSRRSLLRTALGAGTLLGIGACTGKGLKESSKAGEEVSPAEDLMREHGLLNRILLIYEEAAGRLDQGRDVPGQSLAEAADIVRR